MIEINNLTKTRVNQSLIKKISERVLEREKKQGNISLAFVGQGKMRKIDKNYRGKSKVTDVLSFSEEENSFNTSEQSERVKTRALLSLHKKELGEIIICPQEIKKSVQRAKRGETERRVKKIFGKNLRPNKCSFEKELSRVLIHGILHLLGYEHEKGDEKAAEMRKKEECYLQKNYKPLGK